jgi:hypothetical protein
MLVGRKTSGKSEWIAAEGDFNDCNFNDDKRE